MTSKPRIELEFIAPHTAIVKVTTGNETVQQFMHIPGYDSPVPAGSYTRTDEESDPRETVEFWKGAANVAQRHAEKAEKERDRWRKYRDGQAAENPRPLTAREHLDAAWKAAHVTDGRGVLAGDWFLERFSDGTIVTARATWSGMPSGDVRLVRPPAPSRPEGAEEIEAWLDGMPESIRLDGDEHQRLFANHLAHMGFRIPAAMEEGR